MPNYLVLHGGRGGHTIVDVVRGETLLEAIQNFITEGGDNRLSFLPDGSIQTCYSDDTITKYPHVIAYIEENHKIFGEWQIRELPERVLEMAFFPAVCGENSGDVEGHVEKCLPLYRQKYPRSRPGSFVWYFHNGVLVTFFKLKPLDQMENVLRYYFEWGTGNYVEWNGTYNDILNGLYLRWWQVGKPVHYLKKLESKAKA